MEPAESVRLDNEQFHYGDLLSRAHPLAFGEWNHRSLHLGSRVVPAARVELLGLGEHRRVGMQVKGGCADDHLSKRLVSIQPLVELWQHTLAGTWYPSMTAP